MIQIDTVPSSIFLIGLMGVGKSTVGKKLALEYSKHFYDSDHEIQKRNGVTINLIFEIEGEVGFRKREAKIIDELTAIPNIVLATGGGAVLETSNRVCLQKRGLVVYLKSSLAQLSERALMGGRRPLLQTDNPMVVLKKLSEQRNPLYEKTADLIIDVTDRSVPDTIKTIMAEIQKRQ